MTDASQAVTVCSTWWESLGNHSGDRARLRRCATIGDAMMVPSAHRLADALRGTGFTSMRRVALLAALLGQVKICHVDGDSLPMTLGRTHGDRATFSENRFRRLIQASDEDDLLLQLRRAIRILDDQVHLPSLVDAIRYWSFNPESKSTSLVTRWACDYYSSAPTKASA
jgi:CRISPR system Cascade subunit CasB